MNPQVWLRLNIPAPSTEPRAPRSRFPRSAFRWLEWRRRGLGTTQCLLMSWLLAGALVLLDGWPSGAGLRAAGVERLSAASPSQSLPFFTEIQAFVSADRTNPPPQHAVLFIGSSSIRLWTSLAHDFPEYQVINRGFGGSQIVDSVNYFDQIVAPYRPRLIVMYAGGNDINAGKSPEVVFADFKTFVAKVRHALPRARVAYISIAPNPARWSQVDRVRQANRLIEEFTRRDSKLKFIDVFPHMLGGDGEPKPDIYRDDRLHMNGKGYALWQSLVRPYLTP